MELVPLELLEQPELVPPEQPEMVECCENAASMVLAAAAAGAYLKKITLQTLRATSHTTLGSTLRNYTRDKHIDIPSTKACSRKMLAESSPAKYRKRTP